MTNLLRSSTHLLAIAAVFTVLHAASGGDAEATFLTAPGVPRNDVGARAGDDLHHRRAFSVMARDAGGDGGPQVAGSPGVERWGAKLSAGEASASLTGHELRIDQTSRFAVIDWPSFSIGEGETVRLVQPEGGATLIRVTTQKVPSALHGHLIANGSVWIVNPSGIVIGGTGVVNVGAFVVSTLEVSRDAFMVNSTQPRFTGNSDQSVTNWGHITAMKGDVLMFAHQAENHGTLKAPRGTVGLGAGQDILWRKAGAEHVLVQAAEAKNGGGGEAQNSGSISAMQAELRAHGSGSLTVQNTGAICATGTRLKGGRIYLSGGADGGVVNSGELRGTVDDIGGDLQITGKSVKITAGSRIDASGEHGGGQVLIGGDYQGKGAVPTSQRVVVDAGTSIIADAATSGNGGKVVIWSENATFCSGAISAQGGPLDGNGGLVEVSSHNFLSFNGTANRSAPTGVAGTLYLDPTNLTINNADNNINAATPFVANGAASTLSWATISGALAGGPVVVTTVGSPVTGVETGTITIAAAPAVSISSANSLTLTAASSISITAAITTARLTLGGSGLVLNANSGGVAFNAATGITGNLSVTAAGAITQTAPVTVTGTSSFSAGVNPITLSNSSNAFTGAVSANNTGANAIQLTNTLATVLGAINTANNLTVTGVGITQNASGLTVGGTASFAAGANNITLSNAGNNFTTVGITSGNNVVITDTGTLALGTLTVSGTLNVTTTGAVTQSGALPASFGSTSDVPVTANGYTTGGNAATFTLNFAPSSGTILTVVNNTGAAAINGIFSGAPEGSVISMVNNGSGGGTYNARLSYIGNTGNDVTLTFADSPVVTASAATSVTTTSAALSGTVNPKGSVTTAQFEYGLTNSYGSTASVTLSPNNGNAAQNVSANLSSLTAGTLYHYRLTATNAGGTSSTTDGTFTTVSSNANLSNLSASAGAFTVPFGSDTTYLVMAPYSATSTTITPTVAASGATVKVNGVTVASGSASGAIPLVLGNNPAITVVCTAPDGVTTKEYDVVVNRAYPAIGSKDLVFGTGGSATLSHGGTEGNDLGMFLQSDGKAVLATTSNFGGSTNNVLLHRFNTDGSTDYNNNGTATTQGVSATGICADGSGRPLVCGNVNGDAVLLRYTTSGVLDTTFDTDGKVVTDFGGGSDEAIGVAEQSDGKIVVCGTNGGDFVIARYLSTGAPDSAFGTAGMVTTDFGGSETANNIIILSDGNILVSGDCEGGASPGFVVARYLADGALDSNFGTGGKVSTTGIGGENGCAWAMALQSDGKFIVGGREVNANISFAMVRYLADGEVDTTFGSSGFVRTTFGPGSATEGNDIAIQPDGRILIAGTATLGGFSQFALARYESDGSLDTSFDGDGLLTTNFNSTDASIDGIALQSDGRIVAAGYVQGAGGGYSAVVVRYNNLFAPTVISQDVTSVTTTGATLNATVNANGNTVAPSFRFSTDQVNWTVLSADQPLVSGTIPQGITVSVSGLSPATVYYFQAQAEEGNYEIFGMGDVMTFTTSGIYTVTGVTIGKSTSYVQNAAASVVLNPQVISSDYGGPYGFSVHVEGQNISSLGSPPIVTGPFTVFHLNDASLHNQGKLGYNDNDGMWEYGSPNANDWGSPTLTDLDARFGSGTYTITVGAISVPLVLSGDIYPNIPSVTLSGGVWSGGKYYIDPSAVLTVTTNTFTAYGSHAEDAIDSGIDGVVDNSIFASTSPGSKFLSYQVAANTLTFGQEYHGWASFAAVSDLNTAALPGSLNAAYYEKGTEFDIVAMTLQKSWRQTYFGTTANSGNAADTFDFDHDGLANLVEWACNLNPTTASKLPASVVRSGANFEFTYTRSVSALNAGAVFTVEWSDTLLGPSWSSSGVTESILSDNGTVQQVKATIPAGSAGRRFAHLKVMPPP